MIPLLFLVGRKVVAMLRDVVAFKKKERGVLLMLLGRRGKKLNSLEIVHHQQMQIISVRLSLLVKVILVLRETMPRLLVRLEMLPMVLKMVSLNSLTSRMVAKTLVEDGTAQLSNFLMVQDLVLMVIQH